MLQASTLISYPQIFSNIAQLVLAPAQIVAEAGVTVMVLAGLTVTVKLAVFVQLNELVPVTV